MLRTIVKKLYEVVGIKSRVFFFTSFIAVVTTEASRKTAKLFRTLLDIVEKKSYESVELKIKLR